LFAHVRETNSCTQFSIISNSWAHCTCVIIVPNYHKTNITILDLKRDGIIISQSYHLHILHSSRTKTNVHKCATHLLPCHGMSLLSYTTMLSVCQHYTFRTKAAYRRLVWLDESAISCALHKKCIVATLVDLADIHTGAHLPYVLAGHCDKVPTTTELCGSDNLIPEPPNIAHSSGQHGPVTDWFKSARPGNAIPVPKTFT
jgi:hypothetical protein